MLFIIVLQRNSVFFILCVHTADSLLKSFKIVDCATQNKKGKICNF